MTEYIDAAAAMTFVEANYQADPLLRHMYKELLGKLPRLGTEPQPCHMCNNAFVNEELTRHNDLSYVSLGNSLQGYRSMLRSGDGKPVEIIMEHWNGQEMEVVGRYRPKFCPNCGRKLVENGQLKLLNNQNHGRAE